MANSKTLQEPKEKDEKLPRIVIGDEPATAEVQSEGEDGDEDEDDDDENDENDEDESDDEEDDDTVDEE
jgi:hypothetical protein